MRGAASQYSSFVQCISGHWVTRSCALVLYDVLHRSRCDWQSDECSQQEGTSVREGVKK